MSTRSLVAFTGGLDSTYVLHEELKKGHNVEVVYTYVNQNESQALSELTSRRRILTHFNNLYPNQIKDEWIVMDQAVHVMQRNHSERRTQLIQQYNTMNGLLQVILQSSKDIDHRPMTGWHYMDVMENTPEELQSEETYTLYKHIFKSLARSMDVERNIFCNLITPAWDVSKQDMWSSLDEWTQLNISIGCRFDQNDSRNGAVILRDNTKRKYQDYLNLGIATSNCTTTHFDLLSPLDRYFIGRRAGTTDGRSRLFNRCKKYYNDLPEYCHATFNIELMQRILLISERNQSPVSNS